jgi:hypothetical protein
MASGSISAPPPHSTSHGLQHSTGNCYLLIMRKVSGSCPSPFTSLESGIQSLIQSKSVGELVRQQVRVPNLQ